MRLILLFSSLFLLACEKDNKISLNLKHIIKTSYEKPSGNCRKIANVNGFSVHKLGFTQSYQQSLDSILKKTHDTGGNFVFITRASLDGTNLDGISYACSKKKKE